MSSLGDRLREARKRARYTQARLGEIVGVSSQAITQWEAGSTYPKLENLVAIAAILNVTVQWLVSGEALPVHNSTLTLTPGSVRVRGVPMLQAGQVLHHLDGTLDYTDIPKAYAQFECSDRSYAIEVNDDSNAPKLERGYRVVVDPQIAPEPGALVHAAAGKQHRLVIGELWLEAGGVVIVRPIKPAWPAVRSDLEPVQVLGVVTEFTAPARKF